jgi:glutaconyl-CoA/methylmalonyl-CoA decarboxylase subunit gamma
MELIVRAMAGQASQAGQAGQAGQGHQGGQAAAGPKTERLRIDPTGDGYEVEIAGRRYRVEVARVRDGLYSLRVGGAQHELAVSRREDGSYWVSGAQGAVAVEVADPLAWLAAQGAGAKAGRRRQRVTAYMPGRVVELLAAEGQAVRAGQGVLVLEAMKMQNEIQAEHDGTVTRILVQAGQPVDGGDPLFEIE